MQVFYDIFLATWFLLPAAAANVTPILAVKLLWLKKWSTPLDFGKQYKGKEIFGTHKTWRGMVSGMIVAAMVFLLQQILVGQNVWLQDVTSVVPYDEWYAVLLGPLLGFGALGGDAVESFFKRQKGIASGRAWVPFDQLDYIIGAIIVALPFVRFSLGVYVWMIVIWFIVHVVASYVGWLLRLKERPI